MQMRQSASMLVLLLLLLSSCAPVDPIDEAILCEIELIDNDQGSLMGFTKISR
jgi:hypothetical protein